VTETPQVIWADDFESGRLFGSWEQAYCDLSIENDGDNYLLLTAWPTVKGEFGICYDVNPPPREAMLPKAVAISLSFKTLNVGSPGFARFEVAGHTPCDLGLSTEWRTVKFRVGPLNQQCWPGYCDIRATDINNYVSGMALAVDDIVVRAVF
jgi:hypothetical protein